MRQALADREPAAVRGFRHRGHHHVGRIESFSDAVFAFSITLLVVSLQVPRNFDDLLVTMSAFPAFALSFTLLSQIWYVQYRFFRRYALQDLTTIALNIALLFTVVFFTYPLKFLFGLFAQPKGAPSPIRPDQLWQLFAIYGAGYAAVFLIFTLLHRHALRLREALELTPLEVFETRLSVSFNLINVAIAALSVAFASAFSWAHAYALAGLFGGFAYPVGIFVSGWILSRAAKARRAALAGLTP